jgi:L-alanine-DL-glutamate epimerase-like enolase superfamily enzyme
LRDYNGLVSSTGPSEQGSFQAPEAPGLGVELDPSVFNRSDVLIQSIETPS